jgi:3-phenylpropionate/trans-cinnamate dioxygenase ferredoxin subunit
MSEIIDVCAVGEIDAEDVLRFDLGSRSFAIYRSPDDRYYATDGICTHERAYLAEGLVMGTTIECPKHNGVFDYTTGQARGAPVCVNLQTYPVRIAGDRLVIEID